MKDIIKNVILSDGVCASLVGDQYPIIAVKFKTRPSNIERNIIYFDIDLAMSLYSGTSPVTIEIEARDKRFHTSFIMLSFERNPKQKNDIPSESSIPDIYQILANKLGYADVEDIISAEIVAFIVVYIFCKNTKFIRIKPNKINLLE